MQDIATVIDALDSRDDVLESYVLIREVKVLLDVEAEFFHPAVRIRIYMSSVDPRRPYHFTVSHAVHTPDQAGPYYPSVTMFETESLAIDAAIDATTSFIISAIRAGHTPTAKWLIPNDDF